MSRHVDQTMTKVSASGGAYRDYLRFTRPAVARQMRAFGLEFEFCAAERDGLRLAQPCAFPGDVLDLVGGYGTSLFGHNHPELVAVAEDCLRKQKPFSAQASVRSSSAKLAARLSARVGASTGASYVVTFGSTGADAVEAAIKHAALARSRRLADLQARLERDLRRARRDGFAGVAVSEEVSEEVSAGFGPGCRSAEQVLTAALSAVANMRRREPVFVSLEGAFHGKTVGAYALSDHRETPEDFVVPGPRRLGLNRVDWTPEKVVTSFEAELVNVYGIEPDAAGVPRPRRYQLSPIAACFAEPIQGEGGVREVPADVLRALRRLADRHGAALVFDEIQCGMGRTGSFLASEQSGVRADYYLLSKSLGGGLAKISALLVQTELAVDDFGRHHTSTFAEDDPSAEIAFAVTDLLARIEPMIAAAGQRLGTGLEDVAARWPDVFTQVRGRALLRGIQLAPVHRVSKCLETMLGDARLGCVVSGHLLHRYGIRVLPTLSAPTTLRIQPSAYLSDSDIDRLISALDATAAVLRKKDFATLMSHLSLPADPAWLPPRAAMRHQRSEMAYSDSSDAPTRVAFMANLNSAADLRGLAPELARWKDRHLANMLDRVLGEARPTDVARECVASPTGRRVEVIMIAVPLTSAQIVACQRAGHGAFLRSMVLDAVDLAVESGAEVVGLGGYTSMVTSAGRDVIEDRVRVTTGNSLTAASVLEQLREELVSLGPGRRHVAVVGAIGNIGAVMAELLVPQVDSLILVGSSGSEPRLRHFADRFGDSLPVTISADLGALREARVVISATNAAHPIIDRAHLAADRPIVVCDLAAPGDVGVSVRGAANVRVIAGGRTQLPLGQTAQVPGAGLPAGVVFSCLAETILLGFEPETASPSYGALTADGVARARELAERHGFRPYATRPRRRSA
jgi:acetylornithine/succinyldiaminopimelate/putrescine aminotransferase/predicted amino acid dehydrogenase